MSSAQSPSRVAALAIVTYSEHPGHSPNLLKWERREHCSDSSLQSTLAGLAFIGGLKQSGIANLEGAAGRCRPLTKTTARTETPGTRLTSRSP